MIFVAVLVVETSLARSSEAKAGALHPVVVDFIDGNALRRGTGEGIFSNLKKGDAISPEVRVFCRKTARLALRDGPRRLRFLAGAIFTSKTDALFLWEGAFLLDQRDKQVLKSPPFILTGPEVEVACSGRGTLLGEVLTSGGMKLIGLTGSFRLERPGTETSIWLRPGELRFLKPYGRGFGEVVHLNLETLVSTAALVHEFSNEPSLKAELAKVTSEQRPLVIKRYRAQVGDSRTTETFELQPLPERVKGSRPDRH